MAIAVFLVLGIVKRVILARLKHLAAKTETGISLMQIGLPGAVQLVGAAQARIDYWWCDQRHEAGRCTLAVRALVISVRARDRS